MKDSSAIQRLKINPKLKSVNLTIELTSYCNFSCSYCSQGTENSTKKLIDLKTLTYNLKFFLLECKKNEINQFFLIIQGGELSLFKDIVIPYLNLIKNMFADKSIRLVIPTNFSGSLSFYKYVIDIFKDTNILLILNISVHPELLKLKTESKFLELQAYLKRSKNTILEVSILDPNNKDYQQLINFFNQHDILYFIDGWNEPGKYKSKNFYYYIYDKNGFFDNLTKTPLSIFKLRQLEPYPEDLDWNQLSPLEIENFREINYENEMELLKYGKNRYLKQTK
jgi:organic radical activating enzyme